MEDEGCLVDILCPQHYRTLIDNSLMKTDETIMSKKLISVY